MGQICIFCLYTIDANVNLANNIYITTVLETNASLTPVKAALEINSNLVDAHSTAINLLSKCEDINTCSPFSIGKMSFECC